jgi:hypothetical protein
MTMRPSPLPRRRDRIIAGVLIVMVACACAAIVLIGVIIGVGATNGCDDASGPAPADMPHVIVTPEPIPWPSR